MGRGFYGLGVRRAQQGYAERIVRVPPAAHHIFYRKWHKSMPPPVDPRSWSVGGLVGVELPILHQLAWLRPQE